MVRFRPACVREKKRLRREYLTIGMAYYTAVAGVAAGKLKPEDVPAYLRKHTEKSIKLITKILASLEVHDA